MTYCYEFGFASASELTCSNKAGGSLTTWLFRITDKPISNPNPNLYPYPSRACVWTRRRIGLLVVSRGHEAPRRFEACRGETAHPCRNVLQALLGFFIALLGTVSLDGIVCRICLCGWESMFAPFSGRDQLTLTVQIVCLLSIHFWVFTILDSQFWIFKFWLQIHNERLQKPTWPHFTAPELIFFICTPYWIIRHFEFFNLTSDS